jgi:1-acyl-sn-glycerol-3-phosphate acyltransferase
MHSPEQSSKQDYVAGSGESERAGRSQRRGLAAALALLLGAGAGAAGLAVCYRKHAVETRGGPFTRWMPAYWLVRTVCRGIFTIWGRWEVVGADRVPASGGVILAANHVSYMDPPAVGSAVNRPLYYMAKAELFEVPGLGAVLPLVGSYPVHRGSGDRAAVRRTLDLLAAGEAVTIFPEGTRREPGDLGGAEPGFG